MKVLASASLLLGLVLGAVGGRVEAADREAAWKIVAKGLEVAGGEAKLKKLETVEWTEKGKYYGQGAALDYSAKMASHYPDKYRMEIVGVFIIVINGDKGWTNAGGQTTEMTSEQLKHQKEGVYANHVASLYPLKDKAYGLEVVGEVTVDGRACVTVKVTHKDEKDVTLDFDKESGLLARMRRRAWSDEMSKEVDEETTLLSYKDIEGAKAPMRAVLKREGQLFVESDIETYMPKEKLDDSLFSRP